MHRCWIWLFLYRLTLSWSFEILQSGQMVDLPLNGDHATFVPQEFVDHDLNMDHCYLRRGRRFEES